MRRGQYLALIGLGFAFLLLAPRGPAQEKKDAVPPFQPIWPDAKVNIKDLAGVYVYLPPAGKANGAAVVVCPGGGYGGLAMSYEGHDVARWLNTLGVAGIVLKYRVAPNRHPIPLHDAQRAIRHVRSNAKDWHIDTKRVGILGFSAGGHLASTAGTHYDAGDKDAKDPLDRLSCRPDFMILAYPVITLTGPYAHGGSRQNLLGKEPDAKLVEDLSNEKRITAQTPPTFLVHTSEDRAVPPQNSVMFYEALVKNKVPAELHVYEKGRHGLGLGTEKLPFASWPERCAAWMQGRGILTPMAR